MLGYSALTLLISTAVVVVASPLISPAPLVTASMQDESTTVVAPAPLAPAPAEKLWQWDENEPRLCLRMLPFGGDSYFIGICGYGSGPDVQIACDECNGVRLWDVCGIVHPKMCVRRPVVWKNTLDSEIKTTTTTVATPSTTTVSTTTEKPCVCDCPDVYGRDVAIGLLTVSLVISIIFNIKDRI
nr:hypothetical protein MmNV_39 [Menippe mercenaria nudivirus]